MTDSITVVIPTHPARSDNGMLTRALDSVMAQSLLPDIILVELDEDGQGSAVTRNKALAKVDTDWIAWLDSDDELLSSHLQSLLAAAQANDADAVYPIPRVMGPDGEIPLRDEWGRAGKPFDAGLLRRYSYIPVTSLCRTSIAQQCGGFGYGHGVTYDDHGFYLNMLNNGAAFYHLPRITWIWWHGLQNTSGRPDRGDNI